MVVVDLRSFGHLEHRLDFGARDWLVRHKASPSSGCGLP
jgi:hypothetical protein